MQTERFLPASKVTIHLDPKIELDTLQDIIARIYKNSGCSPCGRLSFTINAVDPAEISPLVRGFDKIPSVRGIDAG